MVGTDNFLCEIAELMQSILGLFFAIAGQFGRHWLVWLGLGVLFVMNVDLLDFEHQQINWCYHPKNAILVLPRVQFSRINAEACIQVIRLTFYQPDHLWLWQVVGLTIYGRWSIQVNVPLSRSYNIMNDPIKLSLGVIQAEMVRMKDILVERFTNDNSTIQTNHSEIRTAIFTFTGGKIKPTTRDKTEINRYVRENILEFIEAYVAPKLTPIDKIAKDPHRFVTTLNEVWSHFQVFVFSHYHVCDKLAEFYANFYKMNNGKDYEYRTKFSALNYEVAPVAVMGVNELKKFFNKIQLIKKFKGVFNQFLQYEREGKSVPRSQIRESIHSLESCYFDMDAYTKINEQKKPVIIKWVQKMDKISGTRRSTDAQFFSDHLLHDTLASLNQFYTSFVNQQAMKMNSTDQIRKMIEIIHEEESRAQYYIHTESNRKEYVTNLNQTLIELKLEVRLMKADGFRRYISLYEDKKEDCQKEIRDFWFIYSRSLDKSIGVIKQLFTEYLQSEAEKMADKTKRPPEYIEELIRINSKCIDIVDFCGNNFELQNERNNKIRGMLSNDLTEKGRKEGKFDIGAKNLASYLNNKFKAGYTKGGLESLGDLYRQLVGLFKILQEKSKFIDQHSRYMAGRLLDEVEFSKDLELGHIIGMEKNFIEQIQKECGVSEVKQLVENIKDIEKSIDLNNKLKNKLNEADRFPLNQIIIKNGSCWPEKNSYSIENPPRVMLRSYNCLVEYFKKEDTNVLFEFNGGVSIFQGEFSTGKKQRFQFKNLYLLVLLFVDEERKIMFGNLKKKIEAVGINKQKGMIELQKAVIQLLYSGLLTSSTKSIKPGTPSICKVRETDEFEINRKYDFIEEEKKKKAGRGPPSKPLAIVKGNILTLSEELKKGFEEEIKAFNDDEKNIEAERKFKVEAIVVKYLKHSHHHNINCTFDQLFKATQEGRNKELRTTEKFTKEIIEELINKKYCDRIDGQRNTFIYIA